MKLRKFIRGKNFYFQMLDDDSAIVLESQAYASKDARDNGVDSVKANIRNADRYERIEEDGNQYFILKAGNGQEIGRSRAFDSASELNATLAYAQKGKSTKKAEAPAATPLAAVSSPPQEDGGEAYGTDGKADDYKPLNYYKDNGGNTENGFDSFSAEGEHYFSYRIDGEIYMISEGYKSDKSRDNGIASVERNMDNEDRYQRQKHPNGKFFFNLRAGNNQEISTSRWFDGEGNMNDIIRRLTSSGSGIGHTTTQGLADVNVPDVSQPKSTEPIKKRKKRRTTKKPKAEKVYLAEGDYSYNDIKYQLFRSGNDKHYFTFKNPEGKTILLNSNVRGFDTQEQGRAKLDEVFKHGPKESNYEVKTTKNGKYYFYLKDDEGSNIAKSFFFNTTEDMQTAIASLLKPLSAGADDAGAAQEKAGGLGLSGLSKTVEPVVMEEAEEAASAKAAEEAAASKAAEAAVANAAEEAAEEAAAAKAAEEAVAAKAAEEAAVAKAAEEAAEEAAAAKAAEEAEAAKAAEEAAVAKAAEEAAEEAAAAKAAEEAVEEEKSKAAAALAATGTAAAAVAEEEAAAAKAAEEASAEEAAVTGSGFKWWWIILLILILVLLFYFLR